MADGVAITAGSGTTIATDDAGASGHAQIVKLAISADGSVTLIGGDAANGLDVDVTRIAAGTNLIGDVGLGVRTTGGASLFKTLDIDATEEEVKATAGQVYGYMFANQASSTRYLKFYNATAATVVVGTTVPVITFPLFPLSAGHVAFPVPIAFSTAITVAATTGLADTDTGDPAANDVVLNVLFT